MKNHCCSKYMISGCRTVPMYTSFYISILFLHQPQVLSVLTIFLVSTCCYLWAFFCAYVRSYLHPPFSDFAFPPISLCTHLNSFLSGSTLSLTFVSRSLLFGFTLSSTFVSRSLLSFYVCSSSPPRASPCTAPLVSSFSIATLSPTFVALAYDVFDFAYSERYSCNRYAQSKQMK